MININGSEIKTPKSFQVTVSDIDGEANRNAQGELLRDRVAVKRKLECEWPPLNATDCSTLLKAVQDVFFDVTYPDPLEGKSITKTFYVGDRTAPALLIKDGQVYWQSLKMNFIEQ